MPYMKIFFNREAIFAPNRANLVTIQADSARNNFGST